MKTCPFKNKIIDYLYGELPENDAAQFEYHLDQCSDCFNKVNQYLETIDQSSNRVRPVPQKEFLRSYHQQLKCLYKTDGIINRIFNYIFIRPPLGIRLAEVAVILIIGVFIGKEVRNPTISYQLDKKNDVEVKFLDNYIFQTELLLLDIVNMDNERDLKYILKENHCKRLLQKTLFLKERAQLIKNIRLLNLLNQLELILMELSNLEESTYKEELNFVKNNIKDWHLFVELKAINSSNLL